MATFYLDYENGNNNYGGTSFALLASAADGRITSGVFDSASANFFAFDPVNQYLSINNGGYKTYRISARNSATQLQLAAIPNGDALVDAGSNSQYYIGGRWKTLSLGATAARVEAGDTIRVMASPDPTNMGINGTWTYTTDPVATTSVTAATNATPIAITSTAHGLTTGDTVVIRSVAGNVAANGTWEVTVTSANSFTLDGSVGSGAYTSGGTVKKVNNALVRLASAVTQTISSTGRRANNWTALTNVTTSQNTTNYKQHRTSDLIVVGASFTTGRAAYYTLPATLNLSAYQQVSFWIQAGANLTAGQLTIRLCSDTTGQTTVNTISVPALQSSYWHQFTINNGANLGASIASIALYVATDLGASNVNVYLNNVIAVKAASAADSLSLTSLISKSSTGPWYAIQSIDGTRVMLDGPSDVIDNHFPGEVNGYYGTTETVTLYKRQPIVTSTTPSSSTSTHDAATNGLYGANLDLPVTVSGGWNRTDMSTQTGHTWIHGINGLGIGLDLGTTLSYTTISRMCYTRFLTGISGLNLGVPIGIKVNGFSSACCNNGVAYGSYFGSVDVDYITGYGIGLDLGNINGQNSSSMNISFLGIHGGSKTSSYGIVLRADSQSQINGGSIAYPEISGVRIDSVSYGVIMNNVLVHSPGSLAFQGSSISGPIYGRNCSANLRSGAAVVGLNSYSNGSLSLQKFNNTTDNHIIYGWNYKISSTTAVRHTASGIAWKIEPLSIFWTQSNPVIFPIARVACNANAQVTVSAWMQRSTIALPMALVCKGGQIAGVPNDVRTAAAAADNTWGQVTITFTPTEAGVVEITVETYDSVSYIGYVDDLTITQA